MSADVMNASDAQEERGLAVTVHLVTLAAQVLTAGLLHVVVPAVSLVLFGGKSEFLRGHVKEQLNFQLTYLVLAAAVGVCFFLGWFTLGLGWLVGIVLAVALGVMFVVDLVCSVLAALAASRGDTYSFPFSIRFFS
jgi:uncharacterized Tic20 family protein